MFKKKKKKIIIAVVLLLLAIAAGAVILVVKHGSAPKIEAHIDAAKVYSTIQQNDCTKGMPALAGLQPNNKQQQVSLNLLIYRESCYLENGQEKEALAAAKARLTYDQEVHNQQDIGTVNSDIAFLTKVVQNQGKPSKQKNEPVTPEFAQQLKSEDQK